jgi:hypothetical protein
MEMPRLVSNTEQLWTHTQWHTLSPGSFVMLRGEFLGDPMRLADAPLPGDGIERLERVWRADWCYRHCAQTEKRPLSVRAGVAAMRTYVWITVMLLLGGIVGWALLFQDRRAWSRSKPDESMRRHVNKNY